MKTFNEFINESEFIGRVTKPNMLGQPGDYLFQYRGAHGKGAATLRGIGDWRKITNAMDNQKVKSMTIHNDLPKRLPIILLKIFDKVEAKGYELHLIDKKNT